MMSRMDGPIRTTQLETMKRFRQVPPGKEHLPLLPQLKAEVASKHSFR
jgi:hypothetical protein